MDSLKKSIEEVCNEKINPYKNIENLINKKADSGSLEETPKEIRGKILQKVTNTD